MIPNGPGLLPPGDGWARGMGGRTCSAGDPLPLAQE
jgi:hypothetical protein